MMTMRFHSNMLRTVDEILDEIQQQAEEERLKEEQRQQRRSRPAKPAPPTGEFDAVEELSESLRLLVRLYRAGEKVTKAYTIDAWRAKVELGEALEEVKLYLNQWSWREPGEPATSITEGEIE